MSAHLDFHTVFFRSALFICLVSSLQMPAAAVNRLTGAAGDGEWSEAAKWSGGVLPGNGQNFVIQGSAVNLGTDVALSGITFAGTSLVGSGTGTTSLSIASGQTLTISGLFTVAQSSATAALDLHGSLVMSSSEMWVGQTLGSTGTVTMDTGSLTMNNWFAVGRFGGSGTFDMTGGTLIKQGSNNIVLADAQAANGTTTGVMNISGGSANINTGDVLLGRSNNATSNLSVASGTLNLSGNSQFSLNYVTNGTGGWTSSSSLYVGLVGQNTSAQGLGYLNISDSAVLNVNGGNVVVGNTANTQGTVHMTGGTLNFNAVFTTDSGPPVTVKNNSANLLLGNAADSASTFTLDAGTVNFTDSRLRIGNVSGGSGTFNMTGGTINVIADANATAANGFNTGTGLNAITAIGRVSGATGTFNQSGGDFIIKTTSSSAIPTAARLDIGSAAGSTGIYNLSGGTLSISSTVDTNNASANYLYVGNAGNGTLNMTGGTVTSGSFVSIAASAGGTGLIDISAGTLNQTGGSNFGVGENGNGTLTISGTGLVKITKLNGAGSANGLVLARTHAASSGTVNLNGGTLSVPYIYKGAGASAIFNFNGGVLQVSTFNGSSSKDFMSGLTHAYVKEGGAIIDTNGFSRTLGQALEHGGAAPTDGGLEKRGNGALTFTAVSTYTGVTTLTQGTLALAATGFIDSSKEIAIGAATTLDVSAHSSGYAYQGAVTGTGAVQGSVILGSSAQLRPGASSGSQVGSLTFGGDLTMNGSLLQMQLSAADTTYLPGTLTSAQFTANAVTLGSTIHSGNNDFISVSGTLGWASGSQVQLLLNSYAPQVGDVFKLIDFSTLMGGSVDPDFLLLPNLTSGIWDTSEFLDHGIVAVVIPEPSRFMLLLLGIVLSLLRRRKLP